MRRLRILVVKLDVPKPDRNAGDLRLVRLIEMMAREHDVDICVTRDEAETGAVTREAFDRYMAQLVAVGARLHPIRRMPVHLAVSEAHYDLIFFEFYFTAAKYLRFCRWCLPGTALVVDSVDVQWAREEAGAALGQHDMAHARETKRQELATYRGADVVITCSDLDRALLLAEGRMPPVITVPIVFPMQPRAPGARACEAVFVGSFLHRPNVDGLRWLVRDIWPAVRAQAPEAALTVIGSNATPEIEALCDQPSVRMVGFAESVDPYLDRAAVSVAPLRFGGGMKGKVVQAMARGVPVVTTSVGVQGIPVEAGLHAMVADEPAAFAEAVVGLLRSRERAEQVGLAGQRLVEGLCGPGATERKLAEALALAARPGVMARTPLRWRALSGLMRRLRPSVAQRG